MNAKKDEQKDMPECCEQSTCNVESILSVDDRGQLVLPKEIRDKAGIKGGDKFALISWTKDGKIHCFSLIRSEDLGNYAKELLSPMMTKC